MVRPIKGGGGRRTFSWRGRKHGEYAVLRYVLGMGGRGREGSVHNSSLSHPTHALIILRQSSSTLWVASRISSFTVPPHLLSPFVLLPSFCFECSCSFTRYWRKFVAAQHWPAGKLCLWSLVRGVILFLAGSCQLLFSICARSHQNLIWRPREVSRINFEVKDVLIFSLLIDLAKRSSEEKGYCNK